MRQVLRWRWFWAVIALTAVIALLPLGVQAAMQLVVIKDPETSSKARVKKGKLRVGDANGPLTVDGTVAAQAETVVLTNGGATLPEGVNEFPFDGSAYGQLRVSIQNNTSSTGSVDWAIQQTSPTFIDLAFGTLAPDTEHTETISLPGRELRLVLVPTNNDTSVTYVVYGR
jgi:hypothetical protein